jgi:cupin 2 domain-containing protein
MTIPRPEDRPVIILFDDIPARSADEIFTEVVVREKLHIERIVSTGQSTPADEPHRQGHDEWVLLLAGSASLRIEGEGEYNLRPGDHVFIAAHRAPRTAKDKPTIWLAIDFS